MGIRISTDNTIRPLRPESGPYFNITELNNSVGGWVEPFKVGPVWVMYREKAKEKSLPINEIASYFFEVALYGEVLVIPPQQLPTDWDLMEPHERYIESDMVDSGFMLSLQNALMVKKMKEENPGMIIDPADFFMSQYNVRPKEEYMYEPPSDIDGGTADFLTKVYDYISKSPLQFSNGVLLEDSQVIIRTAADKKKRILELIKEIYLEKEEYEKCAVIQKMEDKYA